MTTPTEGNDTPGRDLDSAGFDTSLGDESTGGEAAEEAVGANEGDDTAPEPQG